MLERQTELLSRELLLAEEEEKEEEEKEEEDLMERIVNRVSVASRNSQLVSRLVGQSVSCGWCHDSCG